MIIILNKSKAKKFFSLSIEYPDYNFNFKYNNEIDFNKFKSTMCNFNNRNFVTQQERENQLIKFNKIKLNPMHLSKCFYMNENLIESFEIDTTKDSSLIGNFLNLIKQKCKFEYLIDLIQSKYHSMDIFYPQPNFNSNNKNYSTFREVNLNLFFEYGDLSEENSMNKKQGKYDEYGEDDSIDSVSGKSSSSSKKLKILDTPLPPTTLPSFIQTKTIVNSNNTTELITLLNYDNIDNLLNNRQTKLNFCFLMKSISLLTSLLILIFNT